jgi:hypothetical protein
MAVPPKRSRSSRWAASVFKQMQRYRLAIPLHAATGNAQTAGEPPLPAQALVGAVRHVERTGRRITFDILLEELTPVADAQLITIGVIYKINLIP